MPKIAERNENVEIRADAENITRKNRWTIILMTLLVMAASFALPALVLGILNKINPPRESVIPVGDLDVPVAFQPLFFLNWLTVFAIIPLQIGQYACMLHIADGERVQIRDLFCRMRYSLKSVGLMFWMGLKTFLWALPAVAVLAAVLAFLLPNAITTGNQTGVTNSVVQVVLTTAPLVFMGLLMGLVVPAMLRYSLAPYVLAEDPSRSIRMCVDTSKQLMDGHKTQLFRMYWAYAFRAMLWGFATMLAVSVLFTILGMNESDIAASIGALIDFAVSIYVCLPLSVAIPLFYRRRTKGMISEAK